MNMKTGYIATRMAPCNVLSRILLQCIKSRKSKAVKIWISINPEAASFLYNP